MVFELPVSAIRARDLCPRDDGIRDIDAWSLDDEETRKDAVR